MSSTGDPPCMNGYCYSQSCTCRPYYTGAYCEVGMFLSTIKYTSIAIQTIHVCNALCSLVVVVVILVWFCVFGSVLWCCCQSVLSFCVTPVEPFPSPLMQLSAQKGATCATMEGGAVGTHRPVTAHLDMEGISVRRSSRMPLVSLQPTHCDSNKWVLQCYITYIFPLQIALLLWMCDSCFLL